MSLLEDDMVGEEAHDCVSKDSGRRVSVSDCRITWESTGRAKYLSI